jgi:drug/metabolite transporter (DMT)-like permease
MADIIPGLVFTRSRVVSSWKAYAAGISWASIFGLSFLVTKGALEAFSPLALLFLRFSLATLALGVLALTRIVRFRYQGKPLAPLVILCLFQPVLYFTLETFGLRETASSTAGLILGAMPAAVAALSVPLLHERLSIRQVAGLLLSVAGVAFIVLGGIRVGTDQGHAGSPGSVRGILLVVGALVSSAFYQVYSRKASVHYGPLETTFAMMLSGAVFFGLLAAVEGMSQGWTMMFARANAGAWFSIVYLGILSSVVAFFLVNLSLSRLKAAQASIFGTLTTLVSLVAGVTLRGELFGPAQAIGAAGIVVGVWLTNTRQAGNKALEP